MRLCVDCLFFDGSRGNACTLRRRETVSPVDGSPVVTGDASAASMRTSDGPFHCGIEARYWQPLKREYPEPAPSTKPWWRRLLSLRD